jgi:hypothetical protein
MANMQAIVENGRITGYRISVYDAVSDEYYCMIPAIHAGYTPHESMEQMLPLLLVKAASVRQPPGRVFTNSQVDVVLDAVFGKNDFGNTDEHELWPSRDAP